MEPRAGAPITFSGAPVSNPNLQPVSGQDRPPKSRDIIGGGSRNQGGVAGDYGKLPVVSGTKLPTTEAQREQPKGPPWKNRKDDTGVPTVGLGEFSREAQIGRLKNPAFGLPDGTGFPGEKDLSGAFSRPTRTGIDDLAGRGGRRTVSETMDSLNRTPHNGDGKNSSSKREQQSSLMDDLKNAVTKLTDRNHAYDRAGNYLGTEGQLRKEAAAQDLQYRRAGIKTEKEAKKEDWDQRRSDFSEAQLRELAKQVRKEAGLTNENQTPTPDAVDNSHVPAAVRNLDGPPKSVAEMEMNKKRQVTLPGENGQKPDRVSVDKKELMGAMVGTRTSNNSTPAPAETTTSGGSSMDKVQRQKLKPGDSRDDLTGGSTGAGGTPGRQPGGNEGAAPAGDGSSSSEGGSEPPRG